MKAKNFIVSLAVYPFDIMVSLGQTEEQLKRSLKRYNVEYHDKMKLSGAGRYLFNTENRWSLIRLNRVPQYPKDYATLQHEIFHSVTHILNHVGMELKIDASDEAYAYLIEYITRQIYERL